MKISIGSCGRFHSIRLAKGLWTRGHLDQLFSAGLLKVDWQELPADLLKCLEFNWLLNIADRVYTKLRLERVLPNSGWYTARDWLFDQWMMDLVRRKTDLADLFVLWANCSEETILFLKSCKKLVVLESGSCHISIQSKILEKEYEKRGFPWAPVWPENRRRMLSEYKLTDFIAVPSTVVRDSFLSMGFNSEKILHIPYGRPADKAKKLNFIQKKPIRFLFVGMVSLQKGIFYLLRAWIDNFGKNTDLKLTLVGQVSQECQSIISEALRSCQNLTIVGPVVHERVKDYYCDADVFIFPSLQEGQAMVIGEAISYGLAIICTKQSGWSDWLKNNQGCLELIAADSLSIAAAIEKIYLNQEICKWLSTNAQLNTKELTWDSYADRALDAYKLGFRNSKSGPELISV